MGKIRWDDFWDDVALSSGNDYYEEKKKWKELSFGSSGRSKDVDSDEFWDDVAFLSDGYYREKERFKTLRYGLLKKKREK